MKNFRPSVLECQAGVILSWKNRVIFSCHFYLICYKLVEIINDTWTFSLVRKHTRQRFRTIQRALWVPWLLLSWCSWEFRFELVAFHVILSAEHLRCLQKTSDGIFKHELHAFRLQPCLCNQMRLWIIITDRFVLWSSEKEYGRRCQWQTFCQNEQKLLSESGDSADDYHQQSFTGTNSLEQSLHEIDRYC